MVFRPLEKYFERKKKNVLKDGDINLEIQLIVKDFINKSFQNSDISSLISIEYKSSDKILYIQCPNKILSSEINLRINNLQFLLQKKKITGIQVVIK